MNKDFTNELQRRINRELGRSMVILVTNMGVHKSILIDVMASLGCKRWPVSPLRLPAGWVGAPTHTFKGTPTWLSQNLPTFWGEEVWPPSSPDCNPLDYYVWGACKRNINRSPNNTLDSLMRTIVARFAVMPCAKTTLACSHYRSRIQLFIEAEEGSIEYTIFIIFLLSIFD